MKMKKAIPFWGGKGGGFLFVTPPSPGFWSRPWDKKAKAAFQIRLWHWLNSLPR